MAGNSGPTMAGEERNFVYKGKTTRRSWPQLPDELIRLIGTFYLLNISTIGHVPNTWETHEHWHQRLAYTGIRDCFALERGPMAVCTGWHRALQSHSVWLSTIPLLDPANLFGSYVYAAQPQHSSGRLSPQAHRQSRASKVQAQVTPWRHLRYILSCSCLVCRINSPSSSYGFTVPNGHRRPMMYTSWLGSIPVCREHEKRKASFCGACLRDNPSLETSPLHSLIGFGPGINPHALMQQHQNAISAQIMEIACMENEDEEMWPGIEATCKSCRLEWLWRKACMQPSDREAIGGPAPPDSPHSRSLLPIPPLHTLLQNSTDWEIRHSVEGFVDMAEGTIADVLTTAREKHWLQKHTRLRELMSQALAARRWVSSAVGESVMNGVSGSGRGDQGRIHPQDRTYEHQREPETYLEIDHGVNQKEVEREREKLAADMDLAAQIEREDREKEEGEYDETRAAQKRARTPSPPVERSLPPHMQRREERQTYEHHATIQFEPGTNTYPNTYYPASSPRTNTTTTATIISLDDAELEHFDDVENDARSHTYARSDMSDDHLDDEEEEEEEEEEDPSVMTTVEKSVLQLALDDWTRSKILDGYWISPADVWYGNDRVYARPAEPLESNDDAEVDVQREGAEGRANGKGRADSRKAGWIMAVHPCPWAIERESESGDFTMSNSESEEESRPRWDTVVEPGPLTYLQTEQVFRAHQKQMRLALLPALQNVVRKIVIECGAAAFPEDTLEADQTQRRTRTESTSPSSSSSSVGRKRKRWVAPSGKRKGLRDPALIASRMSLEEVVRILREEEGVWFDGFDWLEKRRNVREAEDSAAAKRKRDTSHVSIPLGSGSSDGAMDGDDAKATGTPATDSPPKKRRKTQDGDIYPGPAYIAGSALMPAEGPAEEDGTSSGSGTSPVLSTTTLQTTPSPPPSNGAQLEGGLKGKAPMKVEMEQDGDSDVGEDDNEPPVRIPVSPVLESPRLLRTIPYVPLTLKGFPQYTLNAIDLAWRDATMPLYQCHCRICERANMAAAMAEQRRRGHANSDATEYSSVSQQDQRGRYERERTAPPPPSPRREVEQQPYRIPAIRLRPVQPDLPRREEEEEDAYESPSGDEAEYIKTAVDGDACVEVESDDPRFEKVVYHQPEEDDEYDGAVVEIDIQGVAVFNDTKVITTPGNLVEHASPGHSFSADGTPIRSSRKRSCDDQELHLDHAGRTVSVAGPDDAIPRAVSSVTDDLREYAVRPPSPPKRQKTTAS